MLSGCATLEPYPGIFWECSPGISPITYYSAPESLKLDGAVLTYSCKKGTVLKELL